MADGGVKAGVAQTIGEVNEAVVKPVVDEVGKAIESGVQSVVAGPKAKTLDPAAQQKKQLEDEKKRQWALRVIEWNKNLQVSQQKVRQEAQQKLQQKKQEEEQDKQKVKQLKIIEQQKMQQVMAVKQAQTKTEKKGGVGG